MNIYTSCLNFFLGLAMLLTFPVFASHETQIQEIMQILGADEHFEIEILKGGFSGSEIIKVTSSNNAYVFRFWNMKWAEYFPQDLACQLIASEAGYGPHVYFSNEKDGITVMEYLASENLPALYLKGLVDLLKTVHNGPSFPKGVDRKLYLDEIIEENKVSDLFNFDFIRHIKDTIFDATRTAELKRVPCHRDLHPGNLIYTKKGYAAIDFTWGDMDDPYADLANIALFNCETQEEEILLLHLYLGHVPSPKELSRLALTKQCAKLFYGLEFLIISRSIEEHEYTMPQAISKRYMDFGRQSYTEMGSYVFFEYGVSLLTEVMDYAESERFVEDLQTIARESSEATSHYQLYLLIDQD